MYGASLAPEWPLIGFFLFGCSVLLVFNNNAFKRLLGGKMDINVVGSGEVVCVEGVEGNKSLAYKLKRRDAVLFAEVLMGVAVGMMDAGRVGTGDVELEFSLGG